MLRAGCCHDECIGLQEWIPARQPERDRVDDRRIGRHEARASDLLVLVLGHFSSLGCTLDQCRHVCRFPVISSEIKYRKLCKVSTRFGMN